MPEHTLGGPYVQIAAICSMPLVEQQGILSIIRIQDRLQLGGMSDQMQPQPLNSLSLVVILKSGEFNGSYSIQINAITPTGKQVSGPPISALFEGQERGVSIITPLMFVAEEPGLYWFEVMLEGVAVTRIPLRVMYQKIQLPPGMPFPPTAG